MSTKSALLFSLLCTLFSLTTTYAEGKKEMTLDEKKAEVNKHLDTKISEINKAKQCVSDAKDKKAVKECKKKLFDALKSDRKDRWGKKDKKSKGKKKGRDKGTKAEKIKRIDKKIKKLQEKKAELSE